MGMLPLVGSLSPLGQGRGVSVAAFDPSTISGMQLWLKADANVYKDAGSTLAVDGDLVQQWNDQSGNGNHASQATGANRPIFKTNIQNGKPSVRTDGIASYMSGAVVNATTTATVFVAAKRISSQGGASTCIFIRGSQANDYDNPASFIAAYESGSSTIQVYRQVALSVVTHPGNGVAYVFATVFDGANNTAYLNGAAQAAVGSTGSFITDTYYLGTRKVGSLTQFANYELLEILYYAAALNTANRQSVESYLKTRWGTP